MTSLNSTHRVLQQLHRSDVVAHDHVHRVRDLAVLLAQEPARSLWGAAPAARRAKAELAQILAHRLDLSLQAAGAMQMMDRPHVDAGAIRLEVLQWGEEGVLG